MKVKVQINCTARYFGEITMSAATYADWCKKIDAARGLAAETLADELLTKMKLSLGDPSDWGELEIDTFEELKA